MDERSNDHDIFITQSKITNMDSEGPYFDLKYSLNSDIFSAGDSSDEELLNVTQENVKLRFHTMTDDTVYALVSSATSKNTIANYLWAVKLLKPGKHIELKKLIQ